MTKLQSLNAYVTERLMVAAREILEVVSGTVLQFQEEVGRTRRENERLRQRLQEVGFHAQAILHESGCPPAVTGRGSPEVQRRSSGLKEDADPSVSGGKQESTEQHRSKQELLELGVQSADSSGFRPVSDKSPSDEEEFFSPSLAVGRRTAEDEQGAPLGHTLPEQIKVEADTGDYSSAEEPHELSSFNTLYPHSSRQMFGSEGALSQAKGQSSHSCPLCGKTFYRGSHLKLHMRVHTGEKPYSCTICGKRFSQSVHLKVHFRVHTGEKPYSCTVCGKRFSQSSKVKGHLQIHARQTSKSSAASRPCSGAQGDGDRAVLASRESPPRHAEEA